MGPTLGRSLCSFWTSVICVGQREAENQQLLLGTALW
jgi:hypothetical protein